MSSFCLLYTSLAAQQNGDDFFSGVGSGISENNDDKDEDLSWLDNL